MAELAMQVCVAATPQMVMTNNKCGISLKVGGEAGKDYAFERWSHDARTDDHGVIYVLGGTKLSLEHNEQNLIMAGRDQKKKGKSDTRQIRQN